MQRWWMQPTSCTKTKTDSSWSVATPEPAPIAWTCPQRNNTRLVVKLWAIPTAPWLGQRWQVQILRKASKWWLQTTISPASTPFWQTNSKKCSSRCSSSRPWPVNRYMRKRTRQTEAWSKALFISPKVSVLVPTNASLKIVKALPKQDSFLEKTQIQIRTCWTLGVCPVKWWWTAKTHLKLRFNTLISSKTRC